MEKKISKKLTRVILNDIDSLLKKNPSLLNVDRVYVNYLCIFKVSEPDIVLHIVDTPYNGVIVRVGAVKCKLDKDMIKVVTRIQYRADNYNFERKNK